MRIMLSGSRYVLILSCIFCLPSYAGLGLSVFGSYSASLNDGSLVSDFYDGTGFGMSLGVHLNPWEFFIAMRKSQQQSNYTDISPSKLNDHHLRMGIRWSNPKSSRLHNIVEVAGDALSQKWQFQERAYGVSAGLGLGYSLSHQFDLRTVSELSIIFSTSEHNRRRIFNQRLDLAFRF